MYSLWKKKNSLITSTKVSNDNPTTFCHHSCDGVTTNREAQNPWSHSNGSPETSMAKVSLLTPTRLKATHSTVIRRLDGPTVRTLSTSTAPYSSLCTSTVGAWRGIAICSPVWFSLHLPRCNTHTVRQKAPRATVVGQSVTSSVQWYLRGPYPKALVPDDSGSGIAKWGASERGYVFPSHHGNRSLCQWGEINTCIRFERNVPLTWGNLITLIWFLD